MNLNSHAADFKRIVNMEGYWRFSVGDDPSWSEPSYNDENWDRLYVPGTWENQGYSEYNGLAWYRRSFTISSLPDDETIYLEAWQQPGAITGGLNYYRAVGGSDPSPGETLEGFTFGDGNKEPITINVPTLVIWGEKDTALTTFNLDGLEEFVPDLTVKRIPEGSHWVINEKPDEVNRMIREFI